MKGKFIRVLIALVLVLGFSSVTALPAEATTLNVIPYTLGSTTNDSAEWSTTNTAPSGSYSAKLTHTASASEHAWVQFAPPAGITLAEFVAAPTTYGFTYWRTEDKVGPLLEMRFTDGGDALAEITVDMALYDYTTDDLTGQWIVKTASSTEQCMYYGEDSGNVGLSGTGVLGDLSDLITDIAAGAAADDAAAVGAWEMTRVRVDLGWSGDTQDSAWIDDVVIDGTTYNLEGTSADYSTIQSAINAASADDTITVAAGTYLEDISISTANLTLESTAGAATTTILCAGSVNDIVIVTAADVTIDGFTIQGLSATSGARNGIDVRASGCTIQNNIFVDIYYDNILVSGDMTSGTITNNTLTGMGTAAGRGAIWVESYAYDISGITISNNIVSAYRGGMETIFVGQTQTGTVSDITVTGNVVTDCDYGLALDNDGSATTMDTINVTDNTFSQCGVGIAIWPEVTNEPTNVTITGNDITGNTAYGIRILSWDATNAINYNNITGNTVGLLNGDSVSVDATNNWWGNASGPVPATLPAVGYNSYGDPVDDAANVDYEPWLLAVVVSGTTPTTYDKTLALKDDWTLVSTDKEVTTDTAWVGTTVLSGTDTILAYKYTPGTGYPQVTLATQLTSVDAYYIKTDGGGGVGIDYSTSSPGVVTKTLSAGWNVISCAAETNAAILLTQLRYAQIGEQEGAGVTNLIGQATYGQYTATSLSEPLATADDWTAMGSPVTLSAFDGYWVYMNAAKSFGVIPD